MENTSYTSYQGMMAKVDSALSNMEALCDMLQMDESRKNLNRSRNKLESHRFSVGIMGEFKRGKSTVINSLLAQEIMPADILPCSATMNRVTYDLQPHVELLMMDGSVRSIPVEALNDYVTKLTPEHESRAAEVREAVVYYPCRFCQNGVDIVDTPGLNDDERMDRISEEVIPKLDAVIMVVVPGAPFGMSEAEFVRNKLMSSDLSRLIFLVNKIDTVRRPEDRVRVVEEIKQKISKTVLEKMKSMYGEDSQQYKDAALKLGKIRIYPFSALDALDGKVQGDQKLIESSGTQVFEEALTRMLTVERGALELGVPITTLEKTAVDVSNTIESRRQAMSLSTAEYEEKQREALEQLKSVREEKRKEERRLKDRSSEIQSTLAARVPKFYPELRQRMLSAVDGFNPDPAKLTDSDCDELKKRIADATNDAISEFSEKMIVELKDIIQDEASASGRIVADISTQVMGIMSNLSQKTLLIDRVDLIGTGIDVVTDFMGIYGIGGIVSGYRAGGVKGAVVGGGLGLVANLAMGTLLGSISVVGLPLVVVSCMTGTFVSKTLTPMIFKNEVGMKKLQHLKAKAKENIEMAVQEMQRRRDFENWLDGQVEDRFKELIASMEQECDRILNDTQSSMTEIQKDLAKSEGEREQIARRLDDALKRCNAIMTELQPVAARVRAALTEGA